MNESTMECWTWIRSLTWKELLNAMEFVLDDTEHALLGSMIKSQVPPPTPVHPRVFPECSVIHPHSDGKHEPDRIRQDRLYKPRLFQWFPDHHNNNGRNNNKKKPAYTVLARKVQAPDGTRWSLSCTQDQREADLTIEQNTILLHLNADTTLVRFELLPHDAASILRVLQIASRGFFLSKGPPTQKYTAQWLDPTNRWFSLSMYLASRFEVALWQSFRQQQQSCSSLVWKQPSVWTNQYSTSLLESVRIQAFAAAVRDILSQDSKRLTRDCVVWNLLHNTRSNHPLGFFNTVSQESSSFVLPPILMDLVACPLLESVEDPLRRATREHAHALLAQELERALLEDEPPTPSRKKKNRKRKKKKQQQQQEEEKKSEQAEKQSEPPKVATPEQKEPASSDEEEPAQLEQSFEFPDNETSARDRNKNIVLAMSVLEGIMSDIFVQVGLSPLKTGLSPETSDTKGSKEKKTKQRKETMSKPKMGDGRSRQTTQGKAARGKTSTQKESDEPSSPYQNDRFPSAGMEDGAEVGSSGSAFTGPPHLDRRSPSGLFPAHYGTMAGSFFRRPEPLDFAWGASDFGLDGFGRVQRFGNRDKSIFEELFHPQAKHQEARDEMIMASSTAASIASSAEVEFEAVEEIAQPGKSLAVEEAIPATGVPVKIVEPIAEAAELSSDENDDTVEMPNKRSLHTLESDVDESDDDRELAVDHPVQEHQSMAIKSTLSGVKEPSTTPIPDGRPSEADEDEGKFDSRSPSPQAPSTPSPTLSPILVSLADLREMRKGTFDKEEAPELPQLASARSFSSVTASSLPNSPHVRSPNSQMVSSLSRENLRAASSELWQGSKQEQKTSPRSLNQQTQSYRSAVAKHPKYTRDDTDIKRKLVPRRSTDALTAYRSAAARPMLSRDDHDIRHAKAVTSRPVDAIASYRNVAARAPAKEASSVIMSGPDNFKSFSSLQLDPGLGDRDKDMSDRCAKSEIGADGHEDYQQWNDSRRTESHHNDEADNNTVTKDGSTTITSALSQKESEEVSNLREERDTYRDMCLTLGAEVAKLKNMLAAEKGSAIYPAFEYSNPLAQSIPGTVSFDPESVNHFFQKGPRGQTLAAMSDAGYRGEYESLASEDEIGGKVVSSRHMSSGNTIAGSDLSVDHSGHHLVQVPVGMPSTRDVHNPVSLHGMQSRLAREILQFVDATRIQLKKQDIKRDKAVERMTRLVNTVWPRAQVKLYGSHVTGLCLPSSDLDFVICLPAVHKNAPAVAPGALEGRNAVNETSQKLLARKLKGESWVDPRSMKLIERTVVPVIKVATKDIKARTIQLDITFDGPGHHGLQAIDMVTDIIEEFPMIRPLVLVLKQFLLDRGLLTAYTGGLSSYSLFLMTARYLQEQRSSWGDCGSLLMGFLDFYGNHFDPRTTGISVRRRQYFGRPNLAAAGMQVSAQPMQAMWTPPHPLVIPGAPSVGPNMQFHRRNSFSDKGSVDSMRGGTHGMSRPPRFQPAGLTSQRFRSPEFPHPADQAAFEHGMSYTLDPLLVEDPLSEGNNVGRNAFRIFQVQRAFSDAHRALVASLEWDMQSAGDLQDSGEYPLLKCLLQSEDVVFEL